MDSDTKLRCCLEDEFADDLWLMRRLNLPEVIDRIESVCNNDSIIAQSKVAWIRFMNFLGAECSGLHFGNDKQWSELMNLMQISKKLNHRSVKFKDIIKNKHLIESNTKAIRRLNDSAKLLQTIDSSLDQLDAMLNNDCILILRHDSRQQLDELVTTKRFIDDRCRPLLNSLQMELDVGDMPPASSAIQIQQSRARLERLQSVICGLSELLTNMRLLYQHLSQLGPLINADQEANIIKNSDLGQLESSIGSCKRAFAQIQTYQKRLVATLFEVASATSSGAKLRKNSHNSVELRLIKLVGANAKLTKSDILVSSLEEALEQLDKCRAVLDSVMHTLRLEFGRFYFVSDLELLTIIALDSRLVTDRSSPRTKRLLGKLFNNSIEGFVVDDAGQQLIGVQSPYGEIIKFAHDEVGTVPIKKSVNVYSVEIVRILNETLRKLRKSLQFELSKSLNKEDGHCIDWALPLQLMNLAEQIKFCQKVEGALGAQVSGQSAQEHLDKVLKFYEERFKRLSSLKSDDIASKENKKLIKLKFSAAISMTVHFVSTLGRIKEASGAQDWRWLRLVRYYYNKPDGNVEVRVADTCFDYKFDYLPPQANDSGSGDGPQAGGCFKRLTSTQITERCLLAASQSIGNFRLGSSPFGPAGSGKTETIKALGVALGCQVIVHNCDEFNDAQSLDQLIWGLAHTGLWGCFDEFNRLSASALSSISSTLETVQASIREARRMVELSDGRIMPVDGASAFFVTMNPADASQGYRGRRRLPANLRQLFLPIAMTRVQIDAIASESLLALGAEIEDGRRARCLSSQEAKVAGSKLGALIDQLSLVMTPRECAWDLRIVMAILKRLKLLAAESPDSRPALQHLLLKAIDCEIAPRLCQQDLERFHELLSNTFCPNDEAEITQANALGADYKSLQAKLEQACLKQFPGFVAADIAVKHAMQLKRLLDTRAGVILVGPSGSGKSTSWRLLQYALSDSVDWLAVNPRSCQRESLFGGVNESTRKWTDGLITARVRQALAMLLQDSLVSGDDTRPRQIWLILDGPIDPDWIESLNSVLDDNQVLTLSSGERLSFSPTAHKSIKLIIESDSLRFSSPATISRLGLVLHELPLNSGSRPDCTITKTPSEWHQELAEARNVITNENSSLIVVSGSSQDQTMRLEFIKSLLNSNSKLLDYIEYNCSCLSTCKQLLDLVTNNGEPKWFVINNVQLIANEDQWRVKSFMELLRYTITYGGFYDQQLVFRKFNARFIITVDSIDHVDPRTLALATLIHLDCKGLDSMIIELPFDDPRTHIDWGQILETGFTENDSSPIITLSGSEFGKSGWRTSIIKRFQSTHTIMSFRNSKTALRSMEALEKLLNHNSNHLEASRKSGLLFLISDIECELMNAKLQSQLFYKLNQLKRMRGHVAKFIFLTRHHLNEPHNFTQATFWCSMGPVMHVNARVMPFESRNDLHELIRRELSDAETSKLVGKVARLVASHPFEAMISNNVCLLDTFVTAAMDLIRASRAELDGQKRTFGDGLKRLEEFERQVGETKLRCQQEEAELNNRKEEIAALISTIDKALEDAKSQHVELYELKKQQFSKQAEIDLQSRQVDAELADVLKLVETSKTEVGQCLKPEALNEIKALRSPPKTIKDILDVLFILLKIEDSSWTSIRSHLTKCSLRDELTNYDFQNNLNENLLNKADAQMQAKSDSFSVQQAARASKAIVPILGWIRATIEYGRVLIKLKPLGEQMLQLRREAAKLNDVARNLESKLAEVDATISADTSRLDKLKQDHEESLRVTKSVSAQLDRSQLAMHNIEGQIGRWRQRLTWLNATLEGQELVDVN